MGKLGVDRIGAYAMARRGPDHLPHDVGGVPIPGGIGNKSFSREGFVGLFYFGKLDFLVLTQHGSDSAWFGLVMATCPRNGHPSQQHPGNDAARRCAFSILERLHGGNSLCLQSPAYFHPTVRVGAHVAAGNACTPSISETSTCIPSGIAGTRS